jgi:anti-sigma B factor antagonist
MAAGFESPDIPPEDWLFRCEVVREGEAARVRVFGELDMEAVPALSAEMAQLRGTGCRSVVFDLRELSFLDSSGLRFFLDCAGEARRDGFALALIPAPPAVQRVFELTGTSEHLQFVDP